MPRPELLDGAVLGAVRLVVLADLLLAYLDFGADLLAHQPQSLQLLLELGPVLLEREPLPGKRLDQGLLGHVVLLLHVVDGELHLFVHHLDVELANLLVDEFLVHQPVKGGAPEPHLLGRGELFLLLLHQLVLFVQLEGGDHLFVHDRGDAVDDLGVGEAGLQRQEGEEGDAGEDLCHWFLSIL